MKLSILNELLLIMHIEEAQEILQQRKAVNWQVKEVYKPGGQGLTLKVRHKETGEWGVFKYLKIEKEDNIKRFSREIKFLSELTPSHPNIIRVLDYSLEKDNLWLVTQMGIPFENHWKSCQRKFEDNPDALLEEAIRILKGLLEGLAFMHAQDPPIVHRDIKPANIVIIQNSKDRPYQLVLIDFGIVFLPQEERLTPEDGAVGNRRLSHDTMMYRLETVVPWLDIFQVSQLLIWMIGEAGNKNWDRPLDYRYVRYPSNLNERHVLALRAFTGLCAEETLSPKTAAEAIALLDELFFFKKEIKKDNGFESRVEGALQEAKSRRSAEHSHTETNRSDKVRIVETYSHVFRKHFADIETVLADFIEKMQHMGFEVETVAENEFDPHSFISQTKEALDKKNLQIRIRTYRIRAKNGLSLVINYDATFYWDVSNGNLNPFGTHLYGDNNGRSWGLNIQKDGRLWGGVGELLTLEQITALLDDWVADERFWK